MEWGAGEGAKKGLTKEQRQRVYDNAFIRSRATDKMKAKKTKAEKAGDAEKKRLKKRSDD